MTRLRGQPPAGRQTLRRQVRASSRLAALCFVLLCAGQPAFSADPIPIAISGVQDAMAENIRHHIQAASLLGPRLTTERQRRRFLERARSNARQALRPWGYYEAAIRARLLPGDVDDPWTLELRVETGPRVRVGTVSLDVAGAGAGDAALSQWRDDWPLPPEAPLDQTAWEAHKKAALDLLADLGYFQAEFTTARIEVDVEQQRAGLVLRLDTGPRSLMGEIEYDQSVVLPWVLVPVPRFDPGDPYEASLLEQLRIDLWKTGYFEEIEVTEHRQSDRMPPTVDIKVTATPRNRTTHQVILGYGTDTELRLQYDWTRHVLSERGDSLNVGTGWRQRDSETRVSLDYRLPRKRRTPQYWVLDSTARRENEDLAIQDGDGEEIARIASAEVTDFQLRLGRLKLRDNPWGSRRIAETVFLDLLHERNSFRSRYLTGTTARSSLDDEIGVSTQTIALGMDWDWPVIHGSGFSTHGHHERAWWLAASESWGSDVDFFQLYLSSRWSLMLGERWKLLLRAELGHTEADVREVPLEVDDLTTVLSVTELPSRYRFETGGSQSVRGYDLEQLSSNGIGSNHLLTGSVEVEYQLRGEWSAAAFYDIGNAFNDWSDTRLKRGWGVGVRWYSLIGAVRLDLARARDLRGEPWQIYFSIGSPLL